MRNSLILIGLFAVSGAWSLGYAQPPDRFGLPREGGIPGQPGPGGPGPFPGFPGPGGFPGMGAPGGEKVNLLEKFDSNDDGWLNNSERAKAREFLHSDEGKNLKRRGGPGFGRRGPGGLGGPRGREMEPAKPGPRVEPSSVKPVTGDLYEPTVLRTLFLSFENDDWEKELEDFRDTDVDVPATLTVDGKTYQGVGIRFRGMSSYHMVPSGYKRSLNLSIDMVDSEQRLYGYKTLNLLNAHEDESMLSSVLYSHIARQYIPAPKANIVKLVINGESWGLYANVQQFNKEFLRENFNSPKGARWKVSGSPMGGAGLNYLGDDVSEYEKKYEIKSGKKKDWQALIELCRLLDQTPTDQLEQALRKVMNVDGLLWFLALDNVLINCDGYWIRASDFSIYRDPEGIFHILPHDMNEAFRQPMGPGMGGGRGRGGPGVFPFGPPPGFGGGPPPNLPPQERIVEDRLENGRTDEGRRGEPPNQGGVRMPFPTMPPVIGVELDPLIGLVDAGKPLRSKVLAVPSLREKYLENVTTIAEKSLNWDHLGPVVAQYRQLMEKEVEADTKKLISYEAYLKATDPREESLSTRDEGPRFGRPSMPLRSFVEQRRKYLLADRDTK